MHSSLLLEIGGVSFAVTLPIADWLLPLETHYAPFATTGEPAWQVDLVWKPDLADIDQPWSIHEGPVTRFRVAAYEGRIDLARHRAHVSTPGLARATSALDRTLAYICLQVLPRRRQGLLLHGAGIELDGDGYVFCGASGAGKTTIAELAAGRGRVLTDETVLVRLDGEEPQLFSTPFWGSSTPRNLVHQVRRCIPLRAIYLLAHGPEFTLTRLPPARAVADLLMTEKVLTERVDSAEAWLAAAERLLALVPVYQLTFYPTYGLWAFLAQAQGCPLPGGN